MHLIYIPDNYFYSSKPVAYSSRSRFKALYDSTERLVVQGRVGSTAWKVYDAIKGNLLWVFLCNKCTRNKVHISMADFITFIIDDIYFKYHRKKQLNERNLSLPWILGRIHFNIYFLFHSNLIIHQQKSYYRKVWVYEVHCQEQHFSSIYLCFILL